MILARYASRTVYEEQMESLRGSIIWPTNFIHFFRAWVTYMRVELKLSLYEWGLEARRLLGTKPVI